jgi:hypothetical protein
VILYIYTEKVKQQANESENFIIFIKDKLRSKLLFEAHNLKQISESRTQSRRRAGLRNLHVVNIALLAHLEIELLNLCLLEFLVLADQAEAQDSGEND